MHLHTGIVRFIFGIESSANVKCFVPVKELAHVYICPDESKHIGKQLEILPRDPGMVP